MGEHPTGIVALVDEGGSVGQADPNDTSQRMGQRYRTCRRDPSAAGPIGLRGPPDAARTTVLRLAHKGTLFT